ncbi:formate dehydrogenase 1 [Anaeramoeba flamelloides]|uniref:Formate dehydrogenase n=1 Tax=Anaeramoeba flamelloides TaxID=1746091 RepID=A0AAV8A9C7_9EUKA|nr:formate dehydrogenase [Anaeramoeba flamelloides]KAJ6250819.1 formate dehydrogenase 1 [Anaeramoeba flamelloides]
MTCKIFIANPIAEFAIQELKELGEVNYQPSVNVDDLPNQIGDSNILIVRSIHVTSETITKAKDLQLIIRAGAGCDSIDIKKATEKGIFVCNCPGTNSNAVAELVIGFMICADREIPQTTEKLKEGIWCKNKFKNAIGLYGRNIGIVSLGFIGKCVAKAAKGLGMNVYAYDTRKSQEVMNQWGITKIETLSELVQISDVVTVHIVSNEQTKHMFNEEIFKQFKDGAIFINTARGEIVDQSCLPKIVKEKGLKIALDVYENEPSWHSEEFPYTELSAHSVCLSPHIGAITDQSEEATGRMTVEIAKSWISEKKLPMIGIKNKELLK